MRFTLPVSGMAYLGIYDMLGQEVAAPVNAYLAAGTHRLIWNASDLASGVYIYTLEF